MIRKAPWGMVGMLALVAMFEAFVSSHNLDFITRTDLDWQQTGWAAARKAPGHDLLYFGDSQVKFGIQPRLMERHLGRPSYSLALYGGGPPASYYLLRKAIDAGAKPSAVLVNFEQGPLLCDHLQHGHPRHWSELLGLRDCWDLAWSYHDARLFAMLATSYSLPSYRARFEIRASALAALKNVPISGRHDSLAAKRNWALNRGGQVNPRTSEYQGDVPAGYRILVDNWTPLPLNAAYARRFFRLAGKHNIKVFWVMTPFVPAYQADRELHGMDTRYEAFARKLLADCPNVEVIDTRHSGYDHKVFLDPVHLDRRGSSVLTEDVAAILRDRLDAPAGGPRWNLVPPFRDRPADDGLEDAVQSWFVVQREAAEAAAMAAAANATLKR